PATEYDWSLVYPELATGDGERSLSVTEQLDNALENGGIDSELIARLGEGMRSLSETAGALSGTVDAAGATAKYSEQLNSAAA
ncbi:MAG: gliding motility protein GldL, partial [Schleiferiaceae bacterium]